MATVAELMAQLNSDDPVQVSRARQLLHSAAYRVTDPKKPAERNDLADELMTELTATVDPAPGPRMTNVPDSEPLRPVPRHSAPARRFACQLLNQIAGDPQVPLLAALLADLQIRDAVRCVLESISTLVSTTALIKGLGAAGPEFRVGVINSVGRQRLPEAMAALTSAAADPDAEVRLAAIEALANFPEAANDKWIVAATQMGTPRERGRAQAARVRLAETLQGCGESQSAAAIYRSIAADSAEGPWKLAERRAAH